MAKWIIFAKRSLSLLCVVLFVATATSSGWSAKLYTFAVLPKYSPVEMYGMLTPLASYLENRIGVPVQLRLYPDYQTFLSGVSKGEAEISFQDPMVAIKLAPRMEPIAVVDGAANGPQTRGMIVISKEATYSQLKALKGKKVSIVSRLSSSGFLSQCISFADVGLNPFKILELQEAVKNREENVLLAVSMGNAAAGFIEEESGKRLIERLNLDNSVKIMGYTSWIPRWIVSVKEDIPQGIKIKILNALLELPQNTKATQTMGIKGFLPAYNANLDSLNLQIERLNTLKENP